jgi:Holliday junction resolvasome RuvABC endonuclease subunit
VSLGVPAPQQAERRIVGLDLSLSATGVSISNDATLTCSTRLRGVERIVAIRDAVLRVCDKPSTLVVVEGFAMGTGRQSGSYEIGGLGWVIRVALHEHGVPYVEIPPATLKKFATGKGNAGKPDMLASAIRAGYDGPNDDNAIDAWWLRQLGEYANADESHPLTTAYRDDAVAKIEWPITT